MNLIVGLGNPGKEYEKTRHNGGFLAVEFLRKNGGFSDWRLEEKLLAEVSEGTLSVLKGKIGKEKIVLARPQTFMNKSGVAVSALAKFYKIKPKNIIVIHDDSDLFVGRTKLVFNKQSAGHKGVESIIKSLKTDKFYRLRAGIRPAKSKKRADEFILAKFKPAEELILKKVFKKTASVIPLIVKGEIEKAVNVCNTPL